MKKRLRRKIFAAVVAATIMLQGLAFAAIVTPASDNVIVDADFEESTIPSMFKSNFTRVDTHEEGHDYVLVPPEGTHSSFVRYDAYSDTLNKSKIMLSFDYKYNAQELADGSDYIVMLRMNKASSGTADLHLFKAGYKFNPNNGTAWDDLPKFETKRWYGIDMLIDLANGEVDIYIDGQLFAETKYDGISFSSLVSVYINQDANAYFDNFRITEYNGSNTEYSENYEYSEGDTYVKIKYSESLLADAEVLSGIKLINTSTGLDAKSGDAKLLGRTLYVPVESFDYDVEYALCLPENARSITGKSLANLNDYFTLERAVDEVPQIVNTNVNEDFEDSSTNVFGIEPVEAEEQEHGKVMSVVPSQNPDAPEYVPTNVATYDCNSLTRKAIIKFDIKQTKDASVESGDKLQFVSRAKAVDSDTYRDTYMFVLRDNRIGFNSGTAVALGEGWHTVTLCFDYINNTASGWIDSTSLGQVDMNVAGNTYYPHSFHFLSRKNTELEFQVDNFKVGTIAEKAKVANTRIINDGEAYGVCDSIPVYSDSIKVSFTDSVYEDSINAETVKLLTSDGDTMDVDVSLGADGKSAIITLPENGLDISESYVVCVSGVETLGGNEVAEYATSFTTEFINFSVQNFEAVNGTGEKAVDFDTILFDGTEKNKVYAKTSIQNDFNIEKEVNIIFAAYRNDELTDISFNPVKIEANRVKTIDIEDDISYKISDDTEGYALKVFIWDMSGNNIQPKYSNVVIDE